MKAYCDRNGAIHFGPTVPPGMMLVAEAPARELVDVMETCARHTYDGDTLLVPGVPEAESEESALMALEKFIGWVAPRFVDQSGAAA